MRELTVPDVIHRLPPLVEEARRFLRGCRRTGAPRVRVWRGPRRGFGAVYPGSFDPWTLAHDAILRATLRRLRGAVLVLLDLETIDKPSHAAPLAERLAILALHLADQPRVAIGVSTHGRFLEKARALGKATFVVGEDTHERVLAPRYYEDPERELAELHRRARFLVAPRGGVSGRGPRATGARGGGRVAPLLGVRTRHGAWESARLPLSPVDQARSATLARRAYSAGRLPWDQLAPDVLLACWQLRLYGVKRLLPVWVVTAFLERDGRILLVKRGQLVGTHKGAWSGVSGYLDWPVRHLRALIERGPGRWALRQVVQEVREETGIGAESVRLVNAGREIAADDPAHRRQWRVRPFLFGLSPGVRPRLDWENTECDWVTPWDLLHLRVVPRLDQAMSSACGGWHRWYESRLSDLIRDRSSGAMHIALRFLRLAACARDQGLGSWEVQASRRLAAAHPMAPLAWIRDRLAVGMDPRKATSALAEQQNAVLSKARCRLRRARALATYSFSTTVNVLTSLMRKPLTILPDPDGHGERLRCNLWTAFGIEARVSPRPAHTAVLVLGADAVLPDGSIINARGTTKAIREAGLPVVVLAQRCKYVKRCPPLRRGFERVPADVLRDAEFITG